MTQKSLFGTSGIRGDAQKFFNNQFCFDLGITFSLFLDKYHQEGPVAVGMDPRNSSPRILNAIEQGLAFVGRVILDQGAAPVPAINYILKTSSAVGSIMVSGSHIAPRFNGVKFFAFKEEILKDNEKEISQLYQKIMQKNPYRKRKIDITEEIQASEDYEEMLVQIGDSFPCWRVVVDPGNGAQSNLMPRVLERLGLKVKTINNEPQRGFLARDTETEGAFEELKQKVVNEKAAFGIAYDADGDRAVFVDEKGQFIPGDYTGALIAKHSDTKKIITPINTSQVVDYLDKPVVRTKVGSPFVVAAMKKHSATFGFEANGGGISAEIMMSRDGGSTTIKVLKLLQSRDMSLSRLVDTLPKFYLFRTKVDCPSALNSVIIEEAKKKFKGKIENLDGLKIWTDKTTWILFRPSSNAPEFRVFAEAKTQQEVNQLGQNGIDFVKQIIAKNS